ncbi:MAG: HlyD family type I secretion periplasmic adaptor subunit [Pseudomonadota bacterium]
MQGVLRHWDVLKESWSLENQRRKRAKRYEERDFLPAALEVLESPPSPLGRTILISITAFILIALLWAIFGHVDVVATAQGKLIPKERVKVIQPAEYGVVRAIHVADGKAVKAGDVLIELDPSVTGAEQSQAGQSLKMARVDEARAKALLTYLDDNTPPAFIAPDGTATSIALVQQRLIDSQVAEYDAQLAALLQQRIERLADKAVTAQELVKLEETLPLIAEQVDARAQLMAKGLSPRLLYLELKERLVTQQSNIRIQRQQLAKTEAAIASLDRQTDQVKSEFRKQVIADLAEAGNQVALAEDEVLKAATRTGLKQLIAPVDGTVQQLAIHTVGGVVEPAQALMVVVPGEGELIAEALVLNKDIGFVEKGDTVEVKLEAFPFTKYGVIEGTLDDLSMDAIQDETLGLVYQARVSLKQSTIRVNGRDIPLGPGLAATTEIKTGERRIIEFILSPLLRYRDEAFRER